MYSDKIRTSFDVKVKEGVLGAPCREGNGIELYSFSNVIKSLAI